jgi:Asp-tRNA(Asn)/Glu-tRNA(Gln) amidotransferase A subunit family amidase
MLERTSPLTQLIARLCSGDTTPEGVAASSARCANGNASRNTYIHFSEKELEEQAASLSGRFAFAEGRPPLFGVPISLKDCFDLTGTVTTCGARYYAQHHAPAPRDSAMAARLRASAALITGKTHLHPLAYGITGQNPDYGDCLQPRDALLLTGGSSSGAAASVQEGSALAAIGTDTGGSVRVPAALCGLAGYRASHSLAYAAGPWSSRWPTSQVSEARPGAPNSVSAPEGLWAGAAHLAPSFDTVGLLLRDPRDAAPIAHALFGVPLGAIPKEARIGFVGAAFLGDCEADVLAAFDGWRKKMEAGGARLAEIDAEPWIGSQEIFAGIQAHEAAELHRGHYDEFEPAIARRLHWGASLTEGELAPLRQRRAELCAGIAGLFQGFDFLVLPCAPVSRLVAAEDQSSTRGRILRYTTPFSLAGLPAAALPGEMIGAPLGTGIQIAGAQGNDAVLLAYAGALAQAVVDEQG